VREEAREAHVPSLQIAHRARDGLTRAASARVSGHEHGTLRAEALKSLACLAGVRHDWLVVTELAAVSPLEEDELLDSLLPELADSEPEDSEPEDSEPEDSEPEDSEPEDSERDGYEGDGSEADGVEDEPDDVLAAAVRALRFADARSPGSCPDASWT